MTDRQITLARRLFPHKRPHHTPFLRFYSERQLRWLRTHYPHEPVSLVADIMHETPLDLRGFAHRTRLFHTAEYRRERLARSLAEYRRRELMRLRYGLPRLGRKAITEKPYTCQQGNARRRASQKGYILGDHLDETDRWFIYYDDQTLRSRVFERNCRRYRLWVQPLPSWKQ